MAPSHHGTCVSGLAPLLNLPSVDEEAGSMRLQYAENHKQLMPTQWKVTTACTQSEPPLLNSELLDWALPQVRYSRKSDLWIHFVDWRFASVANNSLFDGNHPLDRIL